MSKNQMKLDEVRKLILSLLLARKGATPVPVLERDYYEAEQKRIPYRQFGYTDLVGFLQSIPEHFVVEQYNGCHYVRGIASEKSKHVSSLVARQKVNPRVSQKPPRHPSFHLHQPYNHRMHNKMKSQQIKIAPDKLFLLMQYIKNNPNGVSLQSAVVFVQQIVPFIEISTRELRAQLQELSHQLFLDGNMIYPVWSKDLHNAARQQPLMEEIQPRDKSPNDSGSPPTAQTVYAAGQEDFDEIQYFSDENDFVSPDCASNYQGHAETSKQFATNLAQYADCEQTDMFNYDRDNDMEVSEDFATTKSSTEMKKTAECFDLSQMINDKTQSRLDELIRKRPDGIWCADLPNLYFQEYKVRLNYNQLGFASVREFTSYLPKIFYMTQVSKTDDFRLYSADKRPIVPKTEPIDIAQNLNDQYDEHSTVRDDDAPIPADVPPTITKNFAPNDVMNYNDSVEKILVTELKRNKSYLGVCVVEVFHPNFFWVHLRENKRRFHKMMDELSEFYECNRSTYTIAKIALQKEMNCACVYMGRWHRGIIKSVKPDFRVTVFFYDYGTLKTYAPEDVYYLHKKFSFLPAQAIPCGLCNVKPIVGDRWKKSVIDQFVDKIADHLLAVTIISIDSTYNSMMVVLTDTSEEEDVHINDWLVKERLAQAGKTVRIHDIIYYLRSNTIKSTSIKILHTESAIDVNRPRHYRNQSISHDKRTYRLSDVKTEDIENKTVKSLHNVPTSKKALLQMLRSKSSDSKSLHAKSLDAKCPDAKALDVQSQSKNYQKEESKSPRKLVPVLERLKISNRNRKSIFNPNTSTSETDTDNENNARQIDSSRKVKSQNNNEDYKCYDYMNFSLRDSDNENETKDFGTFRSLYGGHGLMEPFDWSVIKEENNLPHRTITTMPDNLDMSIRKRDSDVEDESGSLNQKNEILGKQYFLNMTRMEKEIFMPENNIDYNVGNMSDFIKMLRDKTASKIVTVMFAPNKLKISQDSSQSEDASNSNINIVELNDVTSSREMDQKINENGKVCETRNDQKMENTNSNTNSESVLSNTNDNMSGEMSECNTSLESNTNAYYPKYKMLLDKMRRKQTELINSNFINTSESSSSEQIKSSSYSYNTSDDTIISSNDEQSKASNCTDTNHMKIHSLKIEELKSMSEERPKNLTLESHNSSETDSIAPSDVDNIRRQQLNQSFNSDSNVLDCNVDDSKCQSNTVNQTAMDVPKLMKQMLKTLQNIGSNTELDSDDLSSSQESVKSDESDESKGDNKSIKSDCVFETYRSMDNDANVTEIAPPIYNDCDVESDESEWDAYAGSKEDFPYFLFTSRNRLSNTDNITEVES